MLPLFSRDTIPSVSSLSRLHRDFVLRLKDSTSQEVWRIYWQGEEGGPARDTPWLRPDVIGSLVRLLATLVYQSGVMKQELGLSLVRGLV